MNTIDTSPDALERAAFNLCPNDHGSTIEERTARDLLIALAAEKRRAREGVTEELVTAAETAYDKVILALPDCDPSDLSRKDAMRAALEAVWPDGRDANGNYKPCARVCNGEVHAYMDETDEGKYVAIVLVDADGHPLGGSSKCTSTSPEGARGQSLKRTGEHAPNSIPATQDTDHD